MIGGTFCHQDPGRLLEQTADCFPFCARCTGIYTGILMSACAAFVFSRINYRNERVNTNKLLATGLFAAFCTLPMQIDGAGNIFKIWDTLPLLRMLTGGAFGFALAFIYGIICHENEKSKNYFKFVRSYSFTASVFLLIQILLIIFFSFIYLNLSYGALLVVTAVVSLYTAVNLLFTRSFQIKKSKSVIISAFFCITYIYAAAGIKNFFFVGV